MSADLPNPKPHELWSRINPKWRLADLTGQPRHNITPEPEGPMEVTAVQEGLVLYRKPSAVPGPATHMMAVDDFIQYFRRVEPALSAESSSG